jgi:cyclopropane fatty-acyl-phospholipid synthase-like methyltransferase/ABC-type nitrate/sulfonate/bicarbonate transport system substrate-binding protein
MTESGHSLPVVRVAGVPEHFNYSWHLGMEKGIFAKHGVQVEFVEMKLGTGAMITSCKNDEVDLIVALTEGLVSDIVKGSDLRLVGTYVQSPLCWAISTGRNSPFNTVEDLKGQTFGISRFSSGSHLMVCVLAMERGWHPQNDVHFAVKGDFQSLRNGVNDGSTAAFLWETFTTKPFHDSGEIRRIGEITTPWPCFMLAGREPVLTQKREAVRAVLAGIREATRLFHSDSENMPAQIAAKYQLQPQDAKQWYEQVQIVGAPYVSEGALERAVGVLYQGKIINSAAVNVGSLLYAPLASLHKDIQHVKLYNKPELLRGLYNNLKAAGLTSGPITYDELLPYDQHHYYGVEALENCIRLTHIRPESQIINIGSGLGGPARYLAGKVGCHVLAVELQEELHRAASELTQRCSLQDKVTHMAGDFLQIGQHLKPSFYDHIVSWLTVLHIPDRHNLFRLCYSVLRPGGIFFAEDFTEVRAGALTSEEKRLLETEVFCPYVPDLPTYKQQLIDAGFEIVTADDVTEEWKAYTRMRVEKFEADRERLVHIHREDTYNRLHYFYNLIHQLYAAGNLGGLRVIARKPMTTTNTFLN